MNTTGNAINLRDFTVAESLLKKRKQQAHQKDAATEPPQPRKKVLFPMLSIFVFMSISCCFTEESWRSKFVRAEVFVSSYRATRHVDRKVKLQRKRTPRHFHIDPSIKLVFAVRICEYVSPATDDCLSYLAACFCVV